MESWLSHLIPQTEDIQYFILHQTYEMSEDIYRFLKLFNGGYCILWDLLLITNNNNVICFHFHSLSLAWSCLEPPWGCLPPTLKTSALWSMNKWIYSVWLGSNHSFIHNSCASISPLLCTCGHTSYFTFFFLRMFLKYHFHFTFCHKGFFFSHSVLNAKRKSIHLMSCTYSLFWPGQSCQCFLSILLLTPPFQVKLYPTSPVQ